MSVAGKVAAISIGVLGGGCVGFWYKETIWAKRKETEYRRLETEYGRLVKLRQERELLLNEVVTASNKK